MSLDAPSPVEFCIDNFQGRCVFLHRPSSTYESPESADLYPFRSLFHGRKRLWEWRLQGKFKSRPGMLYCGIELEEYVPVNFATRSMMRGILPLIQAALQCKLVHHEVGDPKDADLRPTVVAPIWAADNTLIHDNPADAPDLVSQNLPVGLNRKAAREFWEDLWAGGGPSWEDGGPTFTFAVWGPSQLLDLRGWVFRKLPLMWGKELSMEPFCGKQPVHAVVYELQGGEVSSKHHQPDKVYIADLRLMPSSVWAMRAWGGEVYASKPVAVEPAAAEKGDDDAVSFCSAVSRESSQDFGVLDTEAQLLSPDLDAEQRLLAVEQSDNLPSRRTSNVAMTNIVSGIVGAEPNHGWLYGLTQLLRCPRCRRRRSPAPSFDLVV